MLKVYNTLSRSLEEFQPLKDNKVSFYQCGPTVYWTQHIGNLRAMVLANLIRRSLGYLGYKVNFARNYTDVGHLTSDEDEGEDKIIKAARREGLSPEQIADKYIAQFERDVAALNCLPLDNKHKPRATGCIKPMAKMVQTLLDKGFAYATDLAIYFDVSKAKNYTQLSGQKMEMNRQAAGKGEISDKNKKNPADFAVWFFKAGAHKNALQTWLERFTLPDGSVIEQDGFPGWHLECSAMSQKIFGPTLDLHMGGVEHIPVHHTNEIAQSEAATGEKFVDYWLHNEHLTVDGKKMSKSGGTAYALSDIIAKGYDPLALRYFFLQSHYRSKQNFTWEALESAKIALHNLNAQVMFVRPPTLPHSQVDEVFKNKFIFALQDDFNIPQALAIAWDVIKSNLADKVKYALLVDFDRVLGLNLAQAKADKIPTEIKKLAEARWRARAKKDWAEADKLRQQIEQAGWQMEDGKDDYKLKKK